MIPFYSIIIPVYNVEEYLSECVESILVQNFSDYEIILVDDGSKDQSGAICDKYMENNKVRVIHKKNGGLSSARNVGLKVAKGQYIIFIDSDDFLDDSSFLNKVYKLTRESTDLDIVLYGHYKYYASKNKKEKIYYSVDERIIYADIAEMCHKNLFRLSAWGKIVKHSLLSENNIEFRNGVISEDMEWCTQLILYANQCALLNEYPLAYRQREGSITKKSDRKSVRDVFNNLTICEKLEEKTDGERKIAIDEFLSMNVSMLIILLSTISNIERKQYLEDVDRWCIKFLPCYIRTREIIIWNAYKMFGLKITIKLMAPLERIIRR